MDIEEKMNETRLEYQNNSEERRKYEQRRKAILDYNSDVAAAKAELILQMMQAFGFSFEEIMEKINCSERDAEMYKRYIALERET